MPEAHSGEGIFFTSRVADRMQLRSHRIQLEWNRVRQVGQGFADEVFRVFAANHPGTRIRIVNADASVAAMTRHVGGIVE